MLKNWQPPGQIVIFGCVTTLSIKCWIYLYLCWPPRKQDGEGVSEGETKTLTDVDGVTETAPHLLAGYLRYVNHQVGKHHSITKPLSDQSCPAIHS